MEKQRRRTSQIIIRELQERSKECQQLVRSTFRSERIEHPELRKALEHYFSYWNDFTHPGLFSFAFEAAGGRLEKALKPQAAIAMIAAGFDIHDDIIDGSIEKQNHQTVFGKYGQNLSLLLGDAFMINGLTLLGLSVSDLPAERFKKIIETAKRRLFEVGNAHALELPLKGMTEVSQQKYFEIIEMKAASIEADMHIAALIACDRPDVTEALREYGRILGTLATLREEFVDVFEVEELNRRVHKEALPIPIAFALKDADLKDRITKKLKKRELTKTDVDELVDLVFHSEPITALKGKMEKLCLRAEVLAEKLEIQKYKLALRDLVRSTLEDL
jgi:geranylgeranyl pyrophosphate synthase